MSLLVRVVSLENQDKGGEELIAFKERWLGR